VSRADTRSKSDSAQEVNMPRSSESCAAVVVCCPSPCCEDHDWRSLRSTSSAPASRLGLLGRLAPCQLFVCPLCAITIAKCLPRDKVLACSKVCSLVPAQHSAPCPDCQLSHRMALSPFQYFQAPDKLAASKRGLMNSGASAGGSRIIFTKAERT
jgi:hypothetical protein